MIRKLIWRILGAGGMLALAATIAPSAALGAASPKTKTPPRQITVTITDKGFDQSDYTAGFSGSTTDDGAVVTFVNNGTTVHSAQAVPGSLDMGATFGGATTPDGGDLPCWPGMSCAKLQATDTGGIAPNGGTVRLGFQVIVHGADYTLTSGPDCLFGHQSAGFDCTPVTLHLVPISSRSKISGTMAGSVIRPAGSSDCDASIGSPDPSICFSTTRDPGTVLGSPSKPMGDTTVTISDTEITPATLYVKDGATVTWVNKGNLVHSVIQKPFKSFPANGFDFVGPQGLGPGDTYSYTFHMYPGWRKLKGDSISTNVVSFTHNDIVPKSDTDVKLLQGCKLSVKSGKVKTSTECGQPGLISKVITIPTADSVD